MASIATDPSGSCSVGTTIRVTISGLGSNDVITWSEPNGAPPPNEEEWRENPFRIPSYEKAPAYYLAAIRTIQQLASVRPALGHRKVFILGDAEWMVSQEASPEAANAFLKLLEEPPPTTTIILTSSQPGALLPTVRSRVLAIRVGTLTRDEMTKLLVDAGLATGVEAAEIARNARASVRRGLALAEQREQTQPGSLAGRAQHPDQCRRVGHCIHQI